MKRGKSLPGENITEKGVPVGDERRFELELSTREIGER